ncbi:hypothetical protein SXIM_18980 [Streptomyces xiamenensis]|uniref:Uncharacterized protein n=1 Tax=Streptomyces xiamenensis TaxID=408015 RepID=A0A0F7FU69_9ACTN|nr:hypothetical protein SXIM_18980 [Streptomyces xiamenensis]
MQAHGGPSGPVTGRAGTHNSPVRAAHRVSPSLRLHTSTQMGASCKRMDTPGDRR